MASVILLSTLTAVSTPGQAATSTLQTTVTRVLTDTVNYGGCMAALAVSPTTKLAGCLGTWVSFSCTGAFTADKALAYENFDNAKMALAMNKQVFVQFDDTKKHNGYCFASRFDVIK